MICINFIRSQWISSFPFACCHVDMKVVCSSRHNVVPYLEVHIGPMILSLKHPLSFFFHRKFRFKNSWLLFGVGMLAGPPRGGCHQILGWWWQVWPFLMPQTVPTGLDGSPRDAWRWIGRKYRPLPIGLMVLKNLFPEEDCRNNPF